MISLSLHPVDLGSATSSVKSTTSSIPGSEAFQLPAYDDLMGGGQEEEHVMDENERIALQEAEDERLARQLAQGDGSDEVGVVWGGASQ